MKIVLPVHHFLPRYTAGAELYTYRLAKWLRAHGHEVEVVAIESISEGRPDQLTVVSDTYDGIPVHRLSFDIFKAPERDTWDYNNPLFYDWFCDYFRRTQPDLAHFQAGYLLGAAPLRAAEACQVPMVLTLHDYWFLCPRITLLRSNGDLCEHIPDNPAGCTWCQMTERRTFRYLDQATGQWAGKVAQATVLQAGGHRIAGRREVLAQALTLPKIVIAPSRFLASRFTDMIPAGRLLVCNYGLDLAPFQQVTHAPVENTRPLRIGYIGQMAAHKGVHLLVEAFRQLSAGRPATAQPIELHLYGNPDAFPAYAERLKTMAGDDPRITFHGRFQNTRAAEILSALDVSVVPSTWYENQPLAILEARAAGTPVVTSRLGGMAELIEHEKNGLHFNPSDAGDLARQLRRLADEPGLLAKLQAGTATSTPRSIDDEMEQLTALYAQVCDREDRVSQMQSEPQAASVLRSTSVEAKQAQQVQPAHLEHI